MQTGVSTDESELNALANINKDVDLVPHPSEPSKLDTVVIPVEPPLIDLVYRAVEQIGISLRTHVSHRPGIETPEIRPVSRNITRKEHSST